MKIRHHLSEKLLMAYAAGQLPEAFNLVVATHVSLCDECRARLGAYEALGGALLDQCGGTAGIDLADGALDATLARIARMHSEMAPVPGSHAGPSADGAGRPRVEHRLFPAPLRDYAGGDADAVKWRPVGMGVKQAILPTAKDASVRLLYIPAGVAVPDHGHRGMELTLVLQGAFRDAKDRFGPGDVEIADEHLEHTPVAEPGEDCICLAATDAPLRFNALLPRIAQNFLRI